MACRRWMAAASAKPVQAPSSPWSRIARLFGGGITAGNGRSVGSYKRSRISGTSRNAGFLAICARRELWDLLAALRATGVVRRARMESFFCDALLGVLLDAAADRVR